jgi:hypothetical protein
MTEIRIRHEGCADPVSLGDISLSAIDTVIPLLKSWGLRAEDGTVDRDGIYGEFVIRDGKAFFEVMYG